MENFQELTAAACIGNPTPMAVAAPYDEYTLTAVCEARKRGLVTPLLFGDTERISGGLKKLGEIPEDYELYASDKPIESAVESVLEGRTMVLMKGTVTTAALMSACMSKTTGLNRGGTISAVTLCQMNSYGKLLAVSDPALNIAPDLKQKVDITKNLITLLQATGVNEPGIAVLSSSEEVSLKVPSSTDAAIITQMNRRGQISGGVVDGPLALDNAVSQKAAAKKRLDSPVAGIADGIVVPNIECGNALIKSFVYFGGSTNATVALGAAAPIVLPSRAGSLETKLAALALGVLLVKKK